MQFYQELHYTESGLVLLDLNEVTYQTKKSYVSEFI